MTKRKNSGDLLSPRYKLSKGDTEKFWELYSSGLSIGQISKKTHIGKWAIQKVLIKYGYPLRSRREAYYLAVKQGRVGLKKGRRMGKDANSWKGGRTINSCGYMYLLLSDHPRANAGGYVSEHLVVWEKANNKSLPKGWHIHHINGIKLDNRPENLLALPSRKHSLIIPELSKRIWELEEELKRINDEDSLD